MIQEKYIFWGTGDYSKRLIGAIDPLEIAGFCDSYKAGSTFFEKPVYSVDQVPELSKKFTIVVAVEKIEAIKEIASQLRKMNIPFKYAAELLLEKNIPYMELYPQTLVWLAKSYGMEGISIDRLDIEEKYEAWARKIDEKYRSVMVCFVTSEAVGSFCWVYGRFCEYLRDNQKGDVCYCVAHPPQSIGKKFRIANEYLYKKMQERFPEVSSSNIFDWFIYLCRHLDKIVLFDYNDAAHLSMSQVINFYTRRNSQILNEYVDRNISFTREEDEMGYQWLRNMGVSDRFVCFFSRDNVYMEKEYCKETVPSIVYKVCELRNSDINRYCSMTEKLKEKGIDSIRMGQHVADRFNGNGVDYSNIGRTEFLDIWLFSKCMFFIGDGSGIFQIPVEIFNKPVICTTLPMWLSYKGDIFAYHGMLLFYKVYSKRENRFLTLKEILKISSKLDFNILNIYNYWVIQGLKTYPLSDEEIWMAVQEMMDVLEKKKNYTEEDQFLYRRYCEIVLHYLDADKMIAGCFGRPCAAWLKENQWFLE